MWFLKPLSDSQKHTEQLKGTNCIYKMFWQASSEEVWEATDNIRLMNVNEELAQRLLDSKAVMIWPIRHTGQSISIATGQEI